MINILEIAGGSAFLYILIIVCLRLLGKKGLAELSMGDLVLIILIGEALGSIIPQENAFLSAVTCIVTLSLLNFVIEKIAFKSTRFKKLLEGTPVILIKEGSILQDTIKKEKLSLDDLMEAARSNGVDNINDVKKAVLETDGGISIITKT